MRETVVTANRSEQSLTDALPHTTVIGREAIERSQAVDLASLLAGESIENIPTMLFLNIQVLHSVITIQDHIAMRHVCIVLTTILLLLLGLIIVLGDEAFATMRSRI